MASEGYQYSPVMGKTYSLFDRSPSTDEYYILIRQLVDECLQKHPNKKEFLRELQRASARKRLLRRAREGGGDPDLVWLLGRISPALSEYTPLVMQHLDDLSLKKVWDRRLWTTEEQYHLYMLEIELVNVINQKDFAACERKIAFLPHCLKDFKNGCKSSMGDIDYVCRGCSKVCFLNRVSTLLRQNGVDAYIWMGTDLKKLKGLSHSGGRIGGLGIACVPELVMGMRESSRLGLPSVGVPLNANRCARWMGSFYDNSVSLERIVQLVGKQRP
jgi:hypothetical protein